jgi:hypothetical protein
MELVGMLTSVAWLPAFTTFKPAFHRTQRPYMSPTEKSAYAMEKQASVDES